MRMRMMMMMMMMMMMNGHTVSFHNLSRDNVALHVEIAHCA